MATFAVLVALFLFAVLGPWLGRDSRDLRDHPWEPRPADTIPEPRSAGHLADR
jgi:hypothetical protein